jgi:hypothetical protein
VSDSILLGKDGFYRNCKETDRECSSWKKTPRSSSDFIGFEASFIWPLVALEMSQEVHDLDETANGQSSIERIRVIADPSAGVREAERRERGAPATSTPISSPYTSTLDVSFSRDDHLIRSIVITDPGFEGPTWFIKYSDFNKVTIEAPEDAVPAD